MLFLRTVLVQNRAEAADRTFFEDLPVNPLTVILLTLRGVITAADTANPLADVYGTIPALAVTYRGQDVVRGSLQDLAVLNALVSGWSPFGFGMQDGAAEVWSLTVPICFGRRAFDPAECFPAVRRGDLRLEVQVDTVVNNVDLVTVQIETVELLDETPKRFLKYTTNQRTFAGTGEESVRLPIGNPLIGVLLFGTTIPVAAATTATWEQIRTKVDNVETMYARANWDTMHGGLLRRLRGDTSRLQDHFHRYNGAAAAFANTLERAELVGPLANYGYLDFDPLGGGEFQLETAGRADVTIQRDVGVADVGRFIPVEVVTVGGAAAAA